MNTHLFAYILAAALLALTLSACAVPVDAQPVEPVDPNPDSEQIEPAPTEAEPELDDVGGGGPFVEARSDKVRNEIPTVADGDLTELAAGNTEFALDLYHAINSGDDNLFYSPYSVSMALAMTYGGARGETEAQMAQTMRYTLPQERLHPAFNALDLNLSTREYPIMEGQEGDYFQLNIANALWGQQGYEFLPEYLDLIAENYGAGLRLMDFITATEPSRLEINQWVEDQTEERIKDLIPQGAITPDTRLVLTNAIYFNASWLTPFEENATQDTPFYLVDGSEVSVPLMHQQESFAYMRGENYQAVEMPYMGGDMAMLVILPDEGQFAAFEETFSNATLVDIRSGMSGATVDLYLPRFEYEQATGLADVLRAMGMPIAFASGEADFSGMDGTRDLFIGDVLHKAFVKVDENGTEAAAATAVIMKATAIMPEPEITEFRADRPFIFMITDRQTGTTLFVGRVMDPS